MAALISSKHEIRCECKYRPAAQLIPKETVASNSKILLRQSINLLLLNVLGTNFTVLILRVQIVYYSAGMEIQYLQEFEPAFRDGVDREYNVPQERCFHLIIFNAQM